MGLFEAGEGPEDQPADQRGDDRQPEVAEAGRDADAGRQPDAGGGRQAVHLDAVADLQDRSGAEEPDSGDDALDDAARIARVEARLDAGEDDERRSGGDEDVRPQAGRAVDALALEPEHGPEHGGEREPRRARRRKSTWSDVKTGPCVGHAQSPGPTIFSGRTSRSNSSAVR